MPLAPGENVRLRRQDIFDRSRMGLTWLASMAALASMLVDWFLIVQAKQGTADGSSEVNLVVNSWLNMLAFGMAALSSAAVVGAFAMRAVRDAAEIG